MKPATVPPPENTDAYVATFPPEIQTILQKIRATIRRAAPLAEERISYRMPAFFQNGVLIYFAAFRNHIGIFPPVKGNPALIDALAPYAGPKGNLQFPLNQPIPYPLITRIVKNRLSQLQPSAPPPSGSFHPYTRAALREWLAANHTRSEGLWLVLWKKASGHPPVPYPEIVEEALCFGWIDSLPNKLDAGRSLLWLSPRKPRSAWSKVNKARVAQLIAAGLMAPPGLRKIEAAQQDGSWQALDAVENLELPEDLLLAFDQHPGSAQNFVRFPRSAKTGILGWISSARTAATRQKRLNETATLAARNERANQWRKPPSE